jgi:Flp pilus assembly protein TadB
LIAVGLASSGNRSGISARLERYASGKAEAPESGGGSGGLGELLSQSEALAQLNKAVEQRDFGANLARDIARADLKIKPSEFLALWLGSIVGVPLLFLAVSLAMPGLRNPLALLFGFFLGFLLPRFWLSHRRASRLSSFNKQLPDTITLIANALLSCVAAQRSGPRAAFAVTGQPCSLARGPTWGLVTEDAGSILQGDPDRGGSIPISSADRSC